MFEGRLDGGSQRTCHTDCSMLCCCCYAIFRINGDSCDIHLVIGHEHHIVIICINGCHLYFCPRLNRSKSMISFCYNLTYLDCIALCGVFARSQFVACCCIGNIDNITHCQVIDGKGTTIGNTLDALSCIVVGILSVILIRLPHDSGMDR